MYWALIIGFWRFVGLTLLVLLRYTWMDSAGVRCQGGDEALIVSKELPEDDPALGASDLASAIEGCDRSFFFGITCGLSAPYVGGQIEKAMSIPTCTAVVIGGSW